VTHRAGATFGELYESWLTHASGHLAANTVTETRRILDRTLLPRLGDVPLAGLRPEHLDALYADLLRSGRRDGGSMSPATVQRIHGVVRRALTVGVRWGWLTANPALFGRIDVAARRGPVSPASGCDQTATCSAATHPAGGRGGRTRPAGHSATFATTPASTSCACMTCATSSPPASSPPASTYAPSRVGWATPWHRPPSTSTPRSFPTPTRHAAHIISRLVTAAARHCASAPIPPPIHRARDLVGRSWSHPIAPRQLGRRQHGVARTTRCWPSPLLFSGLGGGTHQPGERTGH
jgi:Phage integrase, N-terminal SAM-like domain